MIRLFQRMPEHARTPALTALYAVVAGSAAVAFMLAIHYVYQALWGRLAGLPFVFFLLASLPVILAGSLASGWLMNRWCPAAAGSGIPQLKAAYWKETGVVPLRAILVKFLGGVLALGTGTSLGREGPTVFIAGGLASWLAGRLGIPRRQRRHAAAAGSAAGLAAAFNTPLAAISFVLEELLGDLNSRLLGSVVLASVGGAFIVYALIGKHPSFLMPSVDDPSWNLYLAVPLVAGLAALAGVVFQRSSLLLRERLRRDTRWPAWIRPAWGGLFTWLIGSAIYGATGRLGIFSLGYEDLSQALAEGVGWKVAAALALAKLAASIASYGTGGCGGIFSPTLFIGAMCGFAVGGAVQPWIPLQPADHLILAATGMSACFGSVVRAPFTAILMIFEMTHQFGMVPALMLGTLISQAVARLAGPVNFYDAILVQDGHDLHKIAPPRSLSGWRSLPVSSLANPKPVLATSLEPDALRALLTRHPYRCFPVVIGGNIQGVITRDDIQFALTRGQPPQPRPTLICPASTTLAELDARLVDSGSGLFIVTASPQGPVSGVFTLHDILRAQAALMDS